MGNWDVTTPPGTEMRGRGAFRIRELKLALQEALRGGLGDGIEGSFPGTDPLVTPRFGYRGRKGTTAQRPAAGQSGLYFDTARGSLQRSNGETWEDIATMIPAGSVKAWFQASAPVGWTKKTDHTAKALRVVSGAGGVAGGTADPGGTIQLAHSHVATHTHSMYGGYSTERHLLTSYLVDPASAKLDSYPYKYRFQTAQHGQWHQNNHNFNNSSAAPSTESQLSNVSLAYINIILAEKD